MQQVLARDYPKKGMVFRLGTHACNPIRADHGNQIARRSSKAFYDARPLTFRENHALLRIVLAKDLAAYFFSAACSP